MHGSSKKKKKKKKKQRLGKETNFLPDMKEIWENSWREMPQQVKCFSDKCCIKTGLSRNLETDLQVTEMKVCGGATDAVECVDIFV